MEQKFIKIFNKIKKLYFVFEMDSNIQTIHFRLYSIMYLIEIKIIILEFLKLVVIEKCNMLL